MHIELRLTSNVARCVWWQPQLFIHWIIWCETLGFNHYFNYFVYIGCVFSVSLLCYDISFFPSHFPRNRLLNAKAIIIVFTIDPTSMNPFNVLAVYFSTSGQLSRLVQSGDCDSENNTLTWAHGQNFHNHHRQWWLCSYHRACSTTSRCRRNVIRFREKS